MIFYERFQENERIILLNQIHLDKSIYSTYCFADTNECKPGKHRCDSNAFCNNTKGSYNCTCKPGYFGNGFNCTGYCNKSPDNKNLNLT